MKKFVTEERSFLSEYRSLLSDRALLHVNYSIKYLMKEPVSSTASFPSCSSKVIRNRSGLVSLSFLRAVCSRARAILTPKPKPANLMNFELFMKLK